MFVEQLDWLATNPRYTLRFALHVGLLCRDMPNTAVAAIEHLHHSTVKDLDKRYEEYLKLKIITAFLPPLSRRASRGPL